MSACHLLNEIKYYTYNILFLFLSTYILFFCRKYALLVLNTQIINEKHLVNLWNNATFRITVDGGTNHWFKIANNIEKNCQITKTTQIFPDLISGDLDSIHCDVLSFYENKCEVINTSDQNYTDFMKTLQLLSAKTTVKVDYIVAFSEHSGRLDQILGTHVHI